MTIRKTDCLFLVLFLNLSFHLFLKIYIDLHCCHLWTHCVRELEHRHTHLLVVPVAFRSSLILEGSEAIEREIKRCLREEENLIREGKNPVVYTERQVISLPDDTREKALKRSTAISECLLQMVKRLSVEPSFVVAKGGITSADVGVKALAIRKARVAGQIQPGVPVWIADENSKFPDIPYVIFPGNVGDDETLYNAVKTLIG